MCEKLLDLEFVSVVFQALNGFLLILTCEGEVFFATHSIESYLGFHQVILDTDRSIHFLWFVWPHCKSRCSTASRDMMTDSEESWNKTVLFSSCNVPSFVWGDSEKERRNSVRNSEEPGVIQVGQHIAPAQFQSLTDESVLPVTNSTFLGHGNIAGCSRFAYETCLVRISTVSSVLLPAGVFVLFSSSRKMQNDQYMKVSCQILSNFSM